MISHNQRTKLFLNCSVYPEKKCARPVPGRAVVYLYAFAVNFFWKPSPPDRFDPPERMETNRRIDSNLESLSSEMQIDRIRYEYEHFDWKTSAWRSVWESRIGMSVQAFGRAIRDASSEVGNWIPFWGWDLCDITLSDRISARIDRTKNNDDWLNLARASGPVEFPNLEANWFHFELGEWSRKVFGFTVAERTVSDSQLAKLPIFALLAVSIELPRSTWNEISPR